MIFILTMAFFAGLAYHTVNLIFHASEWIIEPMSTFLPENGSLEYAGKVLDRNGVILAQSVDGKRVYNEDEDVRKACLHVVGDDSVNIGTALQTVYRSRLTGHKFNGSFIFGTGLPDKLKNTEDITPYGADFTLTIDSRLQKAALEALGVNRGAMVFYNYQTGEIVCMVSTPAYDPMNVPEDIETNPAYSGAYLNRAVSAAYPPGSTFKLVTANASLNEISDIENSVYDCPGTEAIDGEKTVSCFRSEPHGKQTMKEALANSCNIYFAKLAKALGKSKMTAYAEDMGFNNDVEFDGVVSAKSVYDVTEASDYELAWSGVGQHTVLETPINMAMISAAIANGGTPVKPYYIQSIDGTVKNETTLAEPMMNKETADKLYEMMDYTATYSYGKDYLCSYLDVCAKTGTAEVGDDGTSHAWITGFCKDADCPLAFAVIVEYGNSAQLVAIPALSHVLYKAAEIFKNQ